MFTQQGGYSIIGQEVDLTPLPAPLPVTRLPVTRLPVTRLPGSRFTCPAGLG
jgi:hypothetical protein